MDDHGDIELDSESGDTTGPGSQSLLVRKNISIKLKGKGRGRGRVKTLRAKKGPINLKKSISDEDDDLENDENVPTKFDIESDISKLEAPTFTTIDRGPPEPMHRNTKLKWDHRVNLIGEKVVNPMIHCCEKCLLPILIYGRMIPCKHVFCLDCAKKTEKTCPRCNDKVQRVEQTGLGTVFMCTFGGSRHGTDGCRRTYLSQRDLQAHINHRHLRAPPPHHEVQTQPQTHATAHHLQQPLQPQPSPTAQIHHTGEYENRDPRELRNLHEPPSLRGVPHHQNMDMHPPHHVPLVHGHPPPLQHPPPHDGNGVLQPPPHDPLRGTYHPREDSHPQARIPPRPHLYAQMPPVTAPQIAHGYASPIPVMSTRTNLITVPIQDDTTSGYHSPHQTQYHPPPAHHQPAQTSTVAYPQQHPPPQHPYSHPPPNHPHSLPISYTAPVSQTPVVYSNPIAPPAFSQPPPHFPPPLHPHTNPNSSTPSIYSNPPPVHHPPPVAHSGPPPAHPPYSSQRFNPSNQPPQYDDSHLSSPPFNQAGPHSGWTNQPPRGPPPPRQLVPNSNPLGPLQPRPPYYHQ